MNHSICYPAGAAHLLITSPGHGVGQAGIAAEDWDLLFCAATDRLRQCASHLLTAGGLSQQAPSAISFSSQVLECVDAFDRLQADLRQQRP